MGDILSICVQQIYIVVQKQVLEIVKHSTERRTAMYISVQEAAKRLDVCEKTIYRRIKDNSLPVIRLSANRIRIDEEDFNQFVSGMKERKPYTRSH